MKTREEIESMSDEERRIKTALCLGWKKEKRRKWAGTLNVQGWGFNKHLQRGDNERKFVAEGETCLFPDYLNSLDVMREVEELMPINKVIEYSRALEGIRGAQPQIPGPFSFVWHATARQRNTAFLMVML